MWFLEMVWNYFKNYTVADRNPEQEILLLAFLIENKWSNSKRFYK